MILVIIRMKVLSEKRMELSQTIALLIGSIRTEKGCKRCDFCQSMEDENDLSLLEEWDTQKNLMGYLKSGRFRILRGAMNLLKEPYEMTFHTVFYPAGMEGQEDSPIRSSQESPKGGTEKLRFTGAESKGSEI
jgi:quinol monooxygenase YgiN